MSKNFKISAAFAQHNNLPVVITANVIRETDRAMYLYGYGNIDPMGSCARCGRTLTHPGSILIGIGPECLQNWGARDERLDNLSDSDILRLQSLIRSMKVDQWIPKSTVRKTWDSDDIVPELPDGHKMNIKRVELTTSDGILTPKPMQKMAITHPDGIKLIFPFNWDDVAFVKGLPGRRFYNVAEGKFWVVPCTQEIIANLLDKSFQLDTELQTIYDKYTTPLPEKEVLSIEIKGAKKKLKDYQKKGVAFAESRNGRVLIADEMGLGKTAQALSYCQLHPEKVPVVIVVPASLKLNWAQEANMWMIEPKVQIISGRYNYPANLWGDLIIINYDILANDYEKYTDHLGKKRKREIPGTGWVDHIIAERPSILILDECHYTKTNDTQRTLSVKKLAKSIPHLIALSGTPILNRPIEIYNVLKMLDPTTPPRMVWAKRYCGAHHNGFGWDYTGATNTRELHERLCSTIMIRRLKADVLQELPDKIYSFVPLESHNMKEYKKAETDFIKWVRINKGDAAARKAKAAEALVKIEALKQLSIQGKMPSVINWVRDFLESDGKIVLFAIHKTTINAIMHAFPGIFVKIDGSTNPTKRQGIMEQFQTDPKIRGFIGNIKAAGVGLTLTASSNVAFLEYPWTPGELAQATDRCHRIGQKDSVNVHYLLVPQTIEQHIAEMLDTKKGVLSNVLDGKDAVNLDLITDLMKAYEKEA